MPCHCLLPRQAMSQLAASKLNAGILLLTGWLTDCLTHSHSIVAVAVKQLCHGTACYMHQVSCSGQHTILAPGMSAGCPSGSPELASAGTRGCRLSSQGGCPGSLNPAGVATHTSLDSTNTHTHVEIHQDQQGSCSLMCRLQCGKSCTVSAEGTDRRDGHPEASTVRREETASSHAAARYVQCTSQPCV